MTSAHGWREKDAAQPCPRVQASPCVYAGWRTCMQAHHPLFFPLLPSSTLLSPLSSMLHPHTPILCHIRSIRLFPLSAPILVILGTNEDSKSESCSALSLSLSHLLSPSIATASSSRYLTVSLLRLLLLLALFPSLLRSHMHTVCCTQHAFFPTVIFVLVFVCCRSALHATLSSSRFSL